MKFYKSQGTEIVMMTNFLYKGKEPYELIFQLDTKSSWINIVFGFEEYEERKEFIENLDQDDIDTLYIDAMESLLGNSVTDEQEA